MVFDPTRRAPLPRGAIVDPARLSALDDLELPDTEPEEAVDRITPGPYTHLTLPTTSQAEQSMSTVQH